MSNNQIRLINSIAIDQALGRADTDQGNVIRVKPGDCYDVKIPGRDYALINIRPSDTDMKFSVGEGVIIAYPYGVKTSAVIIARAQTAIPEETVYDYSSKRDLSEYLYAADSNGIYVFKDDILVRKITDIPGPTWFVTSHSGLIYVHSGNDIVICDEFGNISDTISSIGGESLSSPEGIYFDSAGNIYVSDLYNNAVYKCDSSWNLLWKATNGNMQYMEDGCLYNGVFYASSSAQDKIVKLDPATGAYQGNLITGVESPEGLTVDSSGNFYFSQQPPNGKVVKCNSSGSIITSYSTGSTATSQCSLSDDESLLYVAADTSVIAIATSTMTLSDTFDYTFSSAKGVFLLNK